MKVTIRLLPFVLLQIVIVTVIGINDLYTMGWDPGLLASASFWFKYISNMLAVFLSFYTWANRGIDVVTATPYFLGMESSKEVDLNKYGNIVAIKRHTIDELVTTYRKADIAIFLDNVVNFEEKKKKHLYICQNKLMKLRAKKTFNEAKAKRLEEMMTDTWINKNLKYYKVKYTPVTEAYLVSGVSLKTKGTFRRHVDSKNAKIIKDNYYRLLMSLAYTTLFSSILFDLTDTITLGVIITMLIKVGNCASNSVMGYSYGSKTYITEKVIYELDDRIALMERYVEWKKNNGGVANVISNN